MFIARSEYGKLPSPLTPLSGLLLTASDRPWNQVRILQPTIFFPPLDRPFLMICQTTAPSPPKVVYSRSNTLSKLSSLVPQQSEYVLVLPRPYHTTFHRNYTQGVEMDYSLQSYGKPAGSTHHLGSLNRHPANIDARLLHRRVLSSVSRSV